MSPSNDPAWMPDSIARPTVATATPHHADQGMRARKSTSAISGVSTTYIPVMNPVPETVVRWRPAVCSA